MTKEEMKWEMGPRPLSEMHEWQDNPRKITNTELEKLKRSIERKPYYMNARPIVLSDRTGQNVIIAGNQRYKAVKALGWTEAPAILFHCKTEKEETEIAMVDNHNNGEWDAEKMQKFLKFPLEEWLGSDWNKLAGQMDKINVDRLKEDIPPEPPAEPKSKLGDLYQLGEHRLLVGDATNAQDVQKLTGGGMIDLIVTDPPYNVEVIGGSRAINPQTRKKMGKLTIINDKMSTSEFQNFCTIFSKTMIDSLKPGGAFYIWHASRTQREFENGLENAGVKVREQLIWVKNTFVFGRSDYQWRHEPCFYGFKDGGNHYFIDDRTISTVKEDEEPDFDKMGKKELKETLQKIYDMPCTIIHENRPQRNDSHPDMKPVNLFGRLIKNSSRPGEKVLDPFGGSGTTIIACEQLGRKAYVMELDPRYADATIERWENLTGKKAVKLE